MQELSRPANTQCAVRRIKISKKCNDLSVSSRTHNLGMSLKNEGPGALTYIVSNPRRYCRLLAQMHSKAPRG